MQLGQQPIQPPMPMAPPVAEEGQGGAGPQDLPAAAPAPEAQLMTDPAANSPEMQAQMAGELPKVAEPPTETLNGGAVTAQDQFKKLIG